MNDSVCLYRMHCDVIKDERLIVGSQFELVLNFIQNIENDPKVCILISECGPILIMMFINNK